MVDWMSGQSKWYKQERIEVLRAYQRDLRRVIAKLLKIAGITVALSGCATGVQFVAGDAQTAAAVANAAGLPSDAQCWNNYAAIAGVLGPAAGAAAPPVGILTTVEAKRAIQATMGSPVCLPITTQILGELLKFSSPQGAGLATILGF
jgi:hypothetical protein